MAQQRTTTITAEAAGIIALGGDLPVRRMGFGAMRITGEGIWGEPDDPEECQRALRRAIQVGVNFIDTADSYGPEVSERLIAEALYPYPEELVIGTKGGLVRPGPGRWEPDGRPQHLRKACEGSLRRLRVDQIDLYQFHRPDPKVPFEESVGTLVELKREGKIRHIGLSNVDVDQLERAQRMTPIVSVQNKYSLTDRSSEPVLQDCEERGLVFIPWRPVADSSGEGGPLHEIASRYRATPSQVALAWLLAHSSATLLIPGTSKVAHLEENVAAAGLKLTPADRESLDHL
jgi:pyridoxine 4-dehydrogenase